MNFLKLINLAISQRQIISSDGNASHKIDKSLAKISTSILGTISISNIKNYSDLLHGINNTDLKNKSLDSLVITSLYTNMPVSKCIKHLENHLKKTNATLTLPNNKIIKICTLSTKHCFFFNILDI